MTTLTQLQVRHLRCLADVRLELSPGLNLITGPNGAGKSSVLEAVHLLGYGRSFRGRVSEGLIQSGQAQLEVYAEWVDHRGAAHRAGLRHRGGSWEARLDGEAVGTLGELCAQLAVVTFEPGSHDLIGGGAEHRRRFLDWGLFHVEPMFLGTWRRYARALKQRNALLKRVPGAAALHPWDRELADAGELLTRQRQAYLEQLEPVLALEAARFMAELGLASLEFRPGWKRAELGLEDALLLSRERDLALGYTTVGPHRADWRFSVAALPGGEALSRGQEKLAALACLLAQARDLAQRLGRWPVLCLDDLASELDQAHQRQVLDAVVGSGAQILLTGTQAPEALLAPPVPFRLFHVEHGRINGA